MDFCTRGLAPAPLSPRPNDLSRFLVRALKTPLGHRKIDAARQFVNLVVVVRLGVALTNEKVSRLFEHVGEFLLGHRTRSQDTASTVAQRRCSSVIGLGKNALKIFTSMNTLGRSPTLRT